MPDCPFCDSKAIANRIITENSTALAFLTFQPIVAGHVLISPKRHTKYYEELSSEEKEDIEKLRVRIKEALKKTFDAEGFNYAWNEERIGGQSVPHFHLHILPRKEGDAGVHQYEPRQFLYRSVGIDEREKKPGEELQEVAELIKSSL